MNETIPYFNKITRNSLFNILRYLVSTPISLVLVPYIIKKIGITGFGIWSISAVLSHYLKLGDFGISSALVKYIAEYNTTKQFKKINQLISTAIIIYILVGSAICSVIVVCLNWITTFFFHLTSRELQPEAKFILLGILVIFFISIIFSVFFSLLTALQRIDVTNKIYIFTNVLQMLGVFLFLEGGLGLRGLIINEGIITCITAVLGYFFAKQFFPELKMNFSPVLSHMSQLLAYGSKIFVTSVTGIFIFQADKIILGHFLGMSSVAFYTVGEGIANRLRYIYLLIVNPITPAAAEIYAQKNKEKLEQLYFRSLKYANLVTLPFFVACIIFAKPFINLWLGPGYEKSILVLQMLAIAYYINITTVSGVFILNGIGRPGYSMYFSLSTLALNILLSIYLIIKIGFFGTVIGTISSLILVSIIFIFVFHHLTKIPFRLYSTAIMPTLFASLISAFIAKVLFVWLTLPFLVELLLGGTLFFSTFLFLGLKLHFVDEYALQVFRTIFPQFPSIPVFLTQKKKI